jgi:hypothetical protein
MFKVRRFGYAAVAVFALTACSEPAEPDALTQQLDALRAVTNRSSRSRRRKRQVTT